MAGVSLPTTWRCTECDPPRLVAYEAKSPGSGSLTMRQVVVPTDGGSRVELVVDCELPGAFLGELLDRVYVERRNERDAQHSLENLKDLLEGRPLD